MSQQAYYIGLMSGTSMDSIDAALVDFEEGHPRLIHSLSFPWPQDIKNRLTELATRGSTSLLELGQLDALCGQQFAGASKQLLRQADVETRNIKAIGSHGQTVFHHPHGPAPFSLQIGDPNIIAEQTGIRVVADFRRRDMAAGGQGAPLVPAFHQAVFGKSGHDRVILNIGGIANITVLSANGKVKSGFDTGPGNCLMDRWIQAHHQDPFDKDGAWAHTGHADASLLQRLLEDAYFSRTPPKSTGTEYFSPGWLRRHLQHHPGLPPKDIQATLLQFTAHSIADAIQRWAPDTREVLVCGGGVHNGLLMESLSRLLDPIPVTSTLKSTPGMDPDWIEAMAFAWLARQTLHEQPGNVISVTGAAHPAVLGAIYS